MNQTQAVAKLRKVYGKGFAYRTNPKAKLASERAIAADKAREALAQKAAAAEALAARREAILAADSEYQRIKDELAKLTQEHERLRGIAMCKPITVGVNKGIFFSVEVEGDNWDEVVAEAEKGRK